MWAEWCTSQYSRFDMTFTGFLINGAAGGMSAEAQNLYVPFSWDGMTDQSGYAPSSTVPFLTSGTTPVFQEQDLPGGDVKGATAAVLANYKPGRSFQVYRTVLQPASYHAAVTAAVTAANPNLKVVSPITMAYLARIALGGNNNDRLTCVCSARCLVTHDTRRVCVCVFVVFACVCWSVFACLYVRVLCVLCVCVRARACVRACVRACLCVQIHFRHGAAHNAGGRFV